MISLAQYVKLQIFFQNISVQKLDKDDFVVICSTGAYGSCMSSDYNLRGMAKEIIVKKKKKIIED